MSNCCTPKWKQVCCKSTSITVASYSLPFGGLHCSIHCSVYWVYTIGSTNIAVPQPQYCTVQFFLYKEIDINKLRVPTKYVSTKTLKQVGNTQFLQMRGPGYKHKLTQTVLQTILPDNFAGFLKHAILLLHGLTYHASSHTYSYASMIFMTHGMLSLFHYLRATANISIDNIDKYIHI